jgi:predicted ATP-binding protein involved in virulence
METSAQGEPAGRRIDRLHLRNVGPFRDLDLAFMPRQRPDCADLHVLVGPNGSGKSTILYALAALLGEPGTQVFVAAARRFRGSSGVLGAQMGRSTVVFFPGTSVSTQPPAAPPLPWEAVGLEPVQWVNGLWRFEGLERTVYSYVAQVQASRTPQPAAGQRFSFAAFGYAGGRSLGAYQLTAIQEPAAGPFADALSVTNTADTSTLVQWLANSHTKEALALKDGDRVAAERYASTRRHIEEAVREVIGDEIHFEMKYEPLGIALRRGDTALDLDLLPDGVKSIVSWVGDLLMRLDRIPWVDDVPVLEREILVLLDEIDIHLHPAWQRKILPMAQKLFPRAQIVVSTHSPFVVSSVAAAWVYPLSVTDGVATLGSPIPSQAGTSFSAVVRSVFQVKEEFDVGTERELEQFYEIRNAVLAGDHARHAELEAKAIELGKRGPEVQDIVVSELLQVRARTGLTP